MTTILLARHGETDWNRDGRWQGHLDAPLNAVGLAQAAVLGAHVATLAVDALYSSDLARARQTAAAITATTGLTPVEDARLRHEISTIFETLLGDRTQAWVLEADGSWTRLRPERRGTKRGSHAVLMRRARLRARPRSRRASRSV